MIQLNTLHFLQQQTPKSLQKIKPIGLKKSNIVARKRVYVVSDSDSDSDRETDVSVTIKKLKAENKILRYLIQQNKPQEPENVSYY